MARMTNTSFMTGIKNWVLGKIANIMALIPNQASSSNQLADKNFVNSSIATATATFRGTYNVVSDLSLSYNATHAQIEAALVMKMAALSIVADNNDYAFVQIPTSDATPTEIAMIEKYKYDGTAWAFEYELNNSGFTAAQWAAINSGATLELIVKLSALPSNAELITILNSKASKAANPTAGHLASLDGSGNPTDSGVGIEDNGAYDVTLHNNNAKFASLSELLNSANLNTLIPVDKRYGGMSIKFVHSSDNKYVQYRYMSSSTAIADFTNVANWQGVDDKLIPDSKSLIENGAVQQKNVDFEFAYNKRFPSNYNSNSESDLDFADEQGNVLVRFKDGNVETKKFNSKNTTNIVNGGEESDLDTTDENGNVLLRLKNGEIKTKYFDSYLDTSSKVLYATTNDLSGNNTIQIPAPNIKNHYEINFRGVCDTVGKLSIIFDGQLLPYYHSGRVDIDDTNITTYDYKTWTQNTYAHNLNVSGLVVVNIKTVKPRKAVITISTGTNYSDDVEVFAKEIPWNGCGDKCIASVSNNGAYTDCYLSIGGECFLKDIWIFGDSWTDHWPLYAYEIGCNNYMLDGNSGRTSANAYQSFLKDIAIGKPKTILWMMGMNDEDSSTAINSSWKTYFDLLRTKCNTLGIRLIACTIPNTPERTNYYKNQYIKNSGVRYIDLSGELGCSDTVQGSYGYGDIMQHDGTHAENAGRLLTAIILSKEISLLNS